MLITKKQLPESPYAEESINDYDLIYRDDLPDTTLIPSFIQRVHPGASTVLEFGTGTGRLARPMARAGFRVTGVDLSAPMLQRLDRRSSEEGLAIDAVQGDFTALQLNRRFDVVVVVTSTLFMLPDSQTRIAAFSTAKKHLAPGGVMIVETYAPWIVEQGPRTRSQTADLESETSITLNVEVDRDCRTVKLEQVISTPSGSNTSHETSNWCGPQELDSEAKTTGLHLAERFDNLAGQNWSGTGTNIVSVYTH